MSSNPAWATGYVPSALEWNNTFGGKADEAEMAAKANTTDMNTGLALKQNSAGTILGDDAAAGQIGEYKTASAGPTSMTTNASVNAVSLPLTAGDWDVWGNVVFLPAATTTVSSIVLGLDSTSGTLPGGTGGQTTLTLPFATGSIQSVLCAMQRFSFASPGTAFLVAQTTFGVSTMTCTGFVYARRVR